MGSSQSTENKSNGNNQQQPGGEQNFNWGVPPDTPPDTEKRPDELILQTWASCRSKPVSYTHLDVYKRQAQFHRRYRQYHHHRRRRQPGAGAQRGAGVGKLAHARGAGRF